MTGEAAPHALLHEMGLDDAAIERRKKIVGLDPEDIPRILALKDLVTERADEYVDVFFHHLAGLDEARPLLANRAVLGREHLMAMVAGDYGLPYVEQRVKLGTLYARVGLHARVFLGAFHTLLKTIGSAVVGRYERTAHEGFENFMALKKVAFFDIGLIVDTIVHERERTIRQQQAAIRELSTPVLQIRERMLLLPIIGVIDSHRARYITESLLRAIRANRAKVVVMDITGVSTIDSKVANHLLHTVTAARLMGAIVIVTGLSSEVAQSLVGLGIDLTKLNTVGDLQGGLEEAERILGYRVVQGEPVAAPAVRMS